MAFYLNDFKAHLETLAKGVDVTDHTEPRQFQNQTKKNMSIEESYKIMKTKPNSSNVTRQTIR